MDPLFNYLILGATFMIQLVAFVFVARVSSDYHNVFQGAKEMKHELLQLHLRERRSKLLAEKLYSLALAQARFTQSVGAIVIREMNGKGGSGHLRQVLPSLEELSIEIEVTSHEIGLFSASAEVREKAERSLTFGLCGRDTVPLLGELIELDVDNREEFQRCRQKMIEGLWNARYGRAQDELSS